jgi:hypothetical protein
VPHRGERGQRVVTSCIVGEAGLGTGRHGKKDNGPLTSGPQANSILFQNSNSAQTRNFKMEAFPCSKNTQPLHGAIFEYSKQLSQLG